MSTLPYLIYKYNALLYTMIGPADIGPHGEQPIVTILVSVRMSHRRMHTGCFFLCIVITFFLTHLCSSYHVTPFSMTQTVKTLSVLLMYNNVMDAPFKDLFNLLYMQFCSLSIKTFLWKKKTHNYVTDIYVIISMTSSYRGWKPSFW